VSIPLRTKFRGITERELMIFEGPSGHSEWAAFPEYGDEEATAWLAAAIEWAFEPAPKPVRDKVPVNAILPAVAIDKVSEVLAKAGSFSTLKIKVAESGQDQELDLARIKLAHQLNPEASLRLDANGGFSVTQSLELINKLAEHDIFLEYFEQPVASIAELAELRIALSNSGQSVKIAADESVRRVSDPHAVELAAAADLLVLKSAPLGGIMTALDIAEKSNLDVVPSSALQSSIGLAAELHFAASLPNLNYAAGLGTMSLFAGDLCRDSLRATDGFIELRRPELNGAALDIFRAEDHREDFWVDRLTRCGRALGLEA